MLDGSAVLKRVSVLDTIGDVYDESLRITRTVEPSAPGPDEGIYNAVKYAWLKTKVSKLPVCGYGGHALTLVICPFCGTGWRSYVPEEGFVHLNCCCHPLHASGGTWRDAAACSACDCPPPPPPRPPLYPGIANSRVSIKIIKMLMARALDVEKFEGYGYGSPFYVMDDDSPWQANAIRILEGA